MVNTTLYKNNQGGLHLALLIAVFLISVIGFEIWNYFRTWRYAAETQLRLNRCVGKTAMDLKSTLESVLSSNERIKEIRLALTAVSISIPVQSSLKALLVTLAGWQDLRLTQWNVKTARWILQRGCDGEKDFANPLPLLKFDRDLPDALGPQPLHWINGKIPQQFFIQINHSARYATASIMEAEKINEKEEIDETTLNYFLPKWKAAWSVPKKSFLFNIN